MGGIAGILSAPKSGKETQQDIKKKADDVSKDLSQKYEATKTDAEIKAAELKKKTHDLKDRTQKAVEAAKKEYTKKKS